MRSYTRRLGKSLSDDFLLRFLESFLKTRKQLFQLAKNNRLANAGRCRKPFDIVYGHVVNSSTPT